MEHYNTNPQDFHKMMELGYTLIPLKPQSKVSDMEGWSWKDHPDWKPSKEEQIKWIDTYKDANFGVHAGSVSIIDVDDLRGEWWLKHKGELLGLNPMVVETRKGKHLYFRPTAKSMAHKNKAISKRNKDGTNGVDCRSGGVGYGVAPGSYVIDKEGNGHLYKTDVAIPVDELPYFPDRLIPEPETKRTAISNKGIVKEGQRNEAMKTFAGRLTRDYYGDDFDKDVRDVCMRHNKDKFDPPLTDGEVSSIIDYCVKRETERRDSWDELELPSISQFGIKRALDQMDISVTHNERTQAVMLGGHEVDDLEEAHIRNKLTSRFYTRDSKGNIRNIGDKELNENKWRLCLNGIAHNYRFDPFLEWIKSLKWDGEGRVEHMITNKFGLLEVGSERDDRVNKAMALWASKYVFVGAIQRAMDPGCEIRETPVLVGDIRIGKSMFMNYAFPKNIGRLLARSKWFSGDFSLDMEKKEKVEALLGPVIMEICEMDGTKVDWQAIKKFMTTYDDKARLAYRRNRGDYRRRMIFVGTTNFQEFIPIDKSGANSDRFVPVFLGSDGFDTQAYMDETREQLWAEAWIMYNNGERAGMDRSMLRDLQVAVRRATRGSEVPLFDGVLGLLEDRIDQLLHEGMKWQDIRKYLKERVKDRWADYQLKPELIAAGFYNDGGRPHRWRVRPANNYVSAVIDKQADNEHDPEIMVGITP